MALSTRSGASPVFQGPGGFSLKDPATGSASLYYSLTRLITEGTLTLDGRTWRVRGSSWMDKEFGSNQLGPDQVGWDWVSLRLDDGRDLMLYLLRDKAGRITHASATLIAPDGRARYLAPAAWRLTPEPSRWKSPRTGAEYPVAWTLEVPDARLRLTLTPDLLDQENVSRLVPGLHYWEGSVSATDPTGRRVGRGYIELTGYGNAIRLGL